MTNFEVVQELYRCFREKDHDGFRGLCTEDLVWIQNPGFPKGTIRKGADEVIDGIFKGLRLEWDDFSYNIEQMLDAGSSIVVIGEYLGVHSVSWINRLLITGFPKKFLSDSIHPCEFEPYYRHLTKTSLDFLHYSRSD